MNVQSIDKFYQTYVDREKDCALDKQDLLVYLEQEETYALGLLEEVAADSDFFDKNADNTIGLCNSLFSYITVDWLFPSWEHFSGDIQFPIKPPEGSEITSPGDFYVKASDDDEMLVGKYGEMRKHLFYFVIECLKEIYQK